MYIQMKRISCLIVLLLSVYISTAQQSAVLVMLKSERSKMAHFAKKGDTKNVKLVKQEANKVIEKTMLDFATHFNYCPVYYFMDTSLQMVLERNFDRILFNDKKEIYESSPLKKGDLNFVIVYYGIPPVDVQEKKNKEKTYQGDTYPNNGMVILDPDFKRRARNYDHYIYWPDLFYHISKEYSYSSKIFAMEYKPYARPLQSTLKSEPKVKPGDYYWR